MSILITAHWSYIFPKADYCTKAFIVIPTTINNDSNVQHPLARPLRLLCTTVKFERTVQITKQLQYHQDEQFLIRYSNPVGIIVLLNYQPGKL